MKLHFPLDNPHNNLQANIAKTIKEYYPIGIKAGTDEYNNHPASKKLYDGINDHMENYNVYIKPWQTFIKNLPRGYKSKVHNYGLPNEFSYGGKLVLERYTDDSMLRVKELVFNVSWLGKFYTVFGVDETVIRDEGIGYGYSAVNVITVSPYREFEKGFNYLQSAIENYFEGYKFVPFLNCSFYVKEVETKYIYGFDATVYNCLFSHQLDISYLPSIRLRGDRRYGMGESNVRVRLGPPPPNDEH